MRGRAGRYSTASIRNEASDDLPDRTEVIGGVSHAGDCAGGAHVIPLRPVSHGRLPLLRFSPKVIAEPSPLIFADGRTPPTGAVVGAGEGVALAAGPTVEERQAVMDVVRVRRDRRPSRTRSSRSSLRGNRVELAEQAPVPGVQHVRLAAGRSFKELD